MRKNSGIVQILPLLGVAFLAFGLFAVTSSANQVTNFLNKAADNISYRGSNNPPSNVIVPPGSQEDWKSCVNTQGSKILQTYPSICVLPNGTRVVEPTTQVATTPTPVAVNRGSRGSDTVVINTPAPSSVSWSECINSSGAITLQTYPRVCVYSDGRKVSEPIVVTSPTPTPNQVTILVPTPVASTSSGTNTALNVDSFNRNVGSTQKNVSWIDCITTPGSIILQTYPGICRYPDGRQVTEQVASPVPTIRVWPTPGPSECGGIRGLTCPSGSTCIYSGGSNRAPYPDASGNCQENGTIKNRGSWEECISTEGSKTLQVFPGICVYPDGRKVNQPTSNVDLGISNRANRASSVVGGIFRVINSVIAIPGGYIQRLFGR